MAERPVKGEEALKRMAGQALGLSRSSQQSSEGEKDPLEEAQKFTKQRAASVLIESELAKAQASAEKAKAEAEEAKAKAARAQSGDAGSGGSPLKVSGSVDLGKFNYQEILQQQQNDLKELKKEAEDQAGRQAAISDDLRERLHTQEMLVLKTSFEAQMQVLTKMIETNASRGSFMEQYNAVQEMAKTLGFSQPEAAGDLSSRIELERLKFDQTLELKKMAREEKRADREFQRQLNIDTEEREAKKAERAQQSRRDDMFARAPEVLGAAIGQGMVANPNKGGRVAEEAPSEPKAPREKGGHHVETSWGESGEVGCPGCNQPIAIGSTARMAVCTNCGEQVLIKRVGEKPAKVERE